MDVFNPFENFTDEDHASFEAAFMHMDMILRDKNPGKEIATVVAMVENQKGNVAVALPYAYDKPDCGTILSNIVEKLSETNYTPVWDDEL